MSGHKRSRRVRLWQEKILSQPVQYEEKLICFFDVLGWKKKVLEASNEHVELQKLRVCIEHFSLVAKSEWKNPGFRTRKSTFSDNVVISEPFRPGNFWWFLVRLGELQLASAAMGCLVRGGITIGSLIHTDEIVFGPGLIRAYELESTLAEYPRIILDPELISKFGALPPYIVAHEDGLHFIDVFTPAFVGLITKFTQDRLRSYDATVMREFVPDAIGRLRKELSKPVGQKEWIKLAWLYGRISKNFGLGDSADDYRRTVIHAR